MLSAATGYEAGRLRFIRYTLNINRKSRELSALMTHMYCKFPCILFHIDPPPTSAEVKKMWMYTSIPPYVFMA
jgi:hypothetical protein